MSYHQCLFLCSQESQGECGGEGGGGAETAEDDEFDTSGRGEANLWPINVDRQSNMQQQQEFDANGNATGSSRPPSQQQAYAKQLTVAGSSDMSDVSSDIDEFASQVRKRNVKGTTCVFSRQMAFARISFNGQVA